MRGSLLLGERIINVPRASGLLVGPPSRQTSEYWGGMNVGRAVRQVHRQVFVIGEPLPHLWLDGRAVTPVVDWDRDALRHRLRSGRGPILDRSVLRDATTRRPDAAPPSVLSLVGFVAADPPEKGGRTLARLSGYCRTVLAMPAAVPLDPIAAAEFDLQGITVVSVDRADTVDLLVPGEPGPASGSGRRTSWLRFREEQMFAAALQAGAVASY